MLSATVIFLVDGPIVVRLESLAYLVVIKRPVAPVSNITMAIRAVSLMPSMCGASFVL